MSARGTSGSRGNTRGALLLVVAAAGCGYLAEKGEESRGTENLPSQGIGPWLKYDQECKEEQEVPPGAAPDLSLQPVVIRAEIGHVLSEPSLLVEPDGSIAVYYEDRRSDRSSIRRAVITLGPGELCRPATITVVSDDLVLDASRDGFEAGRVGAPSVVRGPELPGLSPALDATYVMAFEGGEGAGVGLAVSPDGLTWTRVDAAGRALVGAPVPIVAARPDGWEQGTLGSPALAARPDGELLLYFDGNVWASRAIGLATSRDGVVWTRTDGQGRTGDAAGPIVTPTASGPNEQTNWEFQRSDDPDSGSVGAPMVVLDRGPVRDLYVLYYTGNLRGPLVDDYDDFDSSLGVAASEDGIRFRKASTLVEYPATANEVNPVVNERFPLCLAADDLTCLLTAAQPLFDQFHAPGAYCSQPGNEQTAICTRTDPGGGGVGEGSSNALNPLFIVDETEPSVVALGGERFLLAFHQQSDAFNFLQSGIAFAFTNF